LDYIRTGYGVNAMLRVKGDVIQTSQGADFPVEHAKLAFAVIANVRKHGLTWESGNRSIRLGHFAIDRIDANGDVKAGCHFVEWSEIERCARELALIGGAP